jgi:hypothetical protein
VRDGFAREFALVAARPCANLGTMHRSADELLAGLDHVRLSPSDEGPLELIVRRPAPGEREVLAEGELDPTVGLVGDTWDQRSSTRTPDGSPHPGMQVTLMNSRAIALIAGADRAGWPLAGDQLYVDLDLSETNLPPGTRLALGTAAVEISDQPHTGCQQFTQRFGLDALRLVNSPEGRRLRLRGVNATVVDGGTVRVGDAVAVRTRWQEAPATA